MIKDFFTNNIGLKISSLVVAILLWFFVILGGRARISMDVPVAFTEIPQGFEVYDAPKTVSVDIKGQERILKDLKKNDVRAVIDLKDAKAGRAFFTLSEHNIILPRTLVVTGIDPETISLKIETQLTKTVKVKPAVTGLPEKGFAIADVKVAPDTLVIEGPKSVISKIYQVKTEPLDINGINSDLNYRANLNVPDTTIRKNIDKVDVFITVEKIR